MGIGVGSRGSGSSIMSVERLDAKFCTRLCVRLKKVTFATNSSVKVTAEPLDGVDFRQLVPRMSDRNPSLTLQIKSL